MSPVLILIVPPAVNVPQAMALARGDAVETLMNWKCSVLLLVVLALAAVTLLPAITAARESVPAADIWSDSTSSPTPPTAHRSTNADWVWTIWRSPAPTTVSSSSGRGG